MALAEVDDGSDAEFSDREVDDSLYDSSDRASQLKVFTTAFLRVQLKKSV